MRHPAGAQRDRTTDLRAEEVATAGMLAMRERARAIATDTEVHTGIERRMLDRARELIAGGHDA